MGKTPNNNLGQVLLIMFIFFKKWGGSWVKKNIVMCCGIALVMKPHRITVISNATFKKHGRSKKKKKSNLV